MIDKEKHREKGTHEGKNLGLSFTHEFFSSYTGIYRSLVQLYTVSVSSNYFSDLIY